MRILRLAFLSLLIIEIAFFGAIIGLKVSFEKSRASSVTYLSKNLFEHVSCFDHLCSHSTKTDLTVQGLKLTLTSSTSNQMQVNQSYLLIATFSTKDGKTLLSDLPSSVVSSGVAGAEKNTLRNLLGSQNAPCVSAALLPAPPPDIVTISASQTGPLSLEVPSITWKWSVTPRRTGYLTLPLQIEIMGENNCNGSELTGPYNLSSSPSFGLTVVDNTNWGSRILQSISYGQALTTALSTLLSSFVAWAAVEAWKKFTSPQTASASPGSSPGRSQEKNDTTRKRNKKTRHR